MYIKKDFCDLSIRVRQVWVAGSTIVLVSGK